MREAAARAAVLAHLRATPWATLDACHTAAIVDAHATKREVARMLEKLVAGGRAKRWAARRKPTVGASGGRPAAGGGGDEVGAAYWALVAPPDDEEDEEGDEDGADAKEKQKKSGAADDGEAGWTREKLQASERPCGVALESQGGGRRWFKDGSSSSYDRSSYARASYDDGTCFVEVRTHTHA